jgi:hypothetical protein
MCGNWGFDGKLGSFGGKNRKKMPVFSRKLQKIEALLQKKEAHVNRNDTGTFFFLIVFRHFFMGILLSKPNLNGYYVMKIDFIPIMHPHKPMCHKSD